MELANDEDEYGLIARLFHWVVAFLILGLLPVGLFMGGMENSPLKLEIYALHKSFGLLVFFLGVGRLLWRFVSPPPEHLETHKRWETVLASAAHFWLYICILGMPLSGWLMSSAGEFPVPFFGILMPQLIAKDEALGDLFYQLHSIFAYTLLFILALHIAGALKHHVLDKDETLQRMAFRSKGLLLPAVVVLIAGASYAACAYLILAGDDQEAVPVAAPAPAASGAVLLPSVEGLPAHGWTIVPSQSKLQFKAGLYDAPFTGELTNFSGTIVFDPDDLASAKADITISMKDVATGDVDRDKNIVGTDWFDIEHFPESRFESMQFEKADGNNYVVVGNLTIRGVKLPLILPFTLDISGKQAHMSGKARFNRLSYGIGTGQWEDGKTVGLDVEVMVDVTAVR